MYLMILTLAADDVHLEAGVVVPGLDVKSEEPGGDGVLQVAHLHRVRVLVPAQQLQHVTVRTVRGKPSYKLWEETHFNCVGDITRWTETSSNKIFDTNLKWTS